jgi:cleavage stimulation factor subunit 3
MVRKPYDDLLNMLYSQVYKIQQREKEELARLEESFALSHPRNPGYDDDDDDPAIAANRAAKGLQSAALKESSKAQIMVMSKTISAVWINLMRSMRRIQGHGKVNEPLGGSRQIFADARKRGKITSDVYVASALIEYHCYKDPAALKIFERGSKLFPEDEEFALEYLKHLVAINDITSKLRLASYRPFADNRFRCQSSVRDVCWQGPTRKVPESLSILLRVRISLWGARPGV